MVAPDAAQQFAALGKKQGLEVYNFEHFRATPGCRAVREEDV